MQSRLLLKILSGCIFISLCIGFINISNAQTSNNTNSAATINSANSAITPPQLQLAGKWKSGLDLTKYFVSEKYDGVRARWDGQHLISRGGQKIIAPAWFTAGWPRVQLDGELWAGREKFSQTQSTVFKQTPNDDEWKQIKFMVFDMPAHGGTFDARLKALQASLSKASNPAIVAVQQKKITNEAELKKLLSQITKEGAEGLMLHLESAKYEPGTRDNVLKMKEHEEDEAKVIAHVMGKGKNKGKLGSLTVEMPNGKRFQLGTGFTDEQRKNPPPIGSWVTYKYIGTHAKSGLPRFASFLRIRQDEPQYKPNK